MSAISCVLSGLLMLIIFAGLVFLTPRGGTLATRHDAYWVHLVTSARVREGLPIFTWADCKRPGIVLFVGLIILAVFCRLTDWT